MVRELQPVEVYRGNLLDRASARVQRVLNDFKFPIPQQIYDVCSGSSYPDMCLNAYAFAYVKHNGQTRFDGGPYVRHPGEVGKILYEAGVRHSGILVPAFLHDVIEENRPDNGSLEEIKKSDRRYMEEIERKFGWGVASVVQTLTPLPKVGYTKGERNAEMLSRIQETSSYDLRPLLIKGADGLQNLLPDEIRLMEDKKAIDYARYYTEVLTLIYRNLIEIGWYSKWGEEGIQEFIINPLEQRINAVIVERGARQAAQRERAAVFAPEIVPAI